MVEYHYGSLVYPDLRGQKQLKKMYGERVTLVTVGKFRKWVFKTPDTNFDKRDVERASWIAPAPFSCIPYTQVAGCLLGDETTDMVKTSNPRQNNLSFAENFSPETGQI